MAGAAALIWLTPPVSGCVLASNPNPASDTNRAIFAALVDWVTKGHRAAAQHISDAWRPAPDHPGRL